MTTQAIRDTLTTNQAIFDYGFNAILAQGIQSKAIRGRHSTATCAYNGANGNHCIAGHLMSDKARVIGDKENNSYISNVADTLRHEEGLELRKEGYWLTSNEKLLSNMQDLHDSPTDSILRPGEWLSRHNVTVSQEKLDQWYNIAKPLTGTKV